MSGEDRIDLSAIDANTLAAGDQAFAYIGSAAFSGTAGELRHRSDGNDTVLEADVDGDGLADFGIILNGGALPIVADIVL